MAKIIRFPGRNRKNKLQQGESSARTNLSLLRRILALLFFCGIVIFLPLIYTLFDLMILQHDKFEEQAINNQTRSVALTASRGVVYDRNMNILAASTSVETVFIDPNAISKAIKENEKKRLEGKNFNPNCSVAYIANGLAELLDVSPDFVKEQAADTAYYYKVIKRKVPEETAQKVRRFITDNNLSGLIHLEADSQRYYPYGSLAGQIVGFVRSDNVGAEGLEAYYDDTLTGNAGEIVTTKGNAGSEMLYTYEKYYDATDGNSLVLTLDTTVQYYLEKNLEEAVARYDVQNGTFGVVMDINTGEILAMATLGSYDPNNYQEIYDENTKEYLESLYNQIMLKDPGTEAYDQAVAKYNAAVSEARLKQWRNRCVSDGYEPGSTFKLITVAAGLDSGAITLNNTYVCNGDGHLFKGRLQPVDCWKHTGHGAQTTAEALAHSCNPAVSLMSVQMGAETMYSYIKAFGFLEKTEVDLPGEAKGLFFDYYNYVNPKETASLISSSFGQTFRITPMQLIRAVAAVANGGYLLEPYIVAEVQDAEGNVISRTEPTVIRQVISEETSATMRQLMEGVVTDGTASKASVAGYRVGGKTGTSEKIDEYDDEGNPVDDLICSFVGVAPIEDPKYIVLVALDTPNDEIGQLIGGGAMAAPTVSAVFEDILPYLGVEPQYSEEDMNMVIMTMPNLAEMTESEAASALSGLHLDYRRVGSGSTVTGQIPAAGMSVPGKSTVVLYFGEEVNDELIEVPDLSMYSISDCYYLTRNTGIYVLVRGVNKQNGNVLATYQDIPAGTKVPRGTMLTVEFTDYTVSGE